MDSYYGYETALWYWRIAAYRGDAPRHVSRTLELGTYTSTEPQERSQRPNWLDPELIARSGNAVHPLVFHHSRSAARGSLDWHLWSKVPRDAFTPAGDSSFVASPEFLFLQMASILEFPQLVLLGMELCGSYCIDPAEEDGFGRRAVPLTSCAQLAAFLERSGGARGRRAAETALRYLADGAASPMESAIYLLLCLPYKRGGYGLARPSLNLRINLEGDARKLCDSSYCQGDMCWEAPKVDLEYLGVSAHAGEAKMLADRGRTLAIAEMGYDVIEITKAQALDPEAFEVVAKRIAGKLGKRLPKGKCGPIEQRQRLFEAVLAWCQAKEPTDTANPEPYDEPVIGKMA